MQNGLNFRDFGNYPTINGKWIKAGLLYRSGTLDHVKGNDLKTIKSIGFRTHIDLRTPKEYRNRFPLNSIRKRAISLNFDQLTRDRIKPFLYKRNSGEFIVETINSVYEDMVHQSLPQIAELFSILLSEESYPVLINCRAGKDRTGFIVAIIQLALETKTEYIVYDYLVTNEKLKNKVNKAITLSKWFTLGIFPYQNLRTTFTAHEKYIQTVIEKITNQYHGIEGYLKKAGISMREIQQLREILLTEEQSSFKIC